MKEINQARIAIWIPVIVAVVGGIFSLFAADSSRDSRNETNEIREQIEKLDNALREQNIEAEENIETLKTTMNKKEEIPVGTVVASLLTPKEFYESVDSLNDFDKYKSKWCYADGTENVSGSGYWKLTGKIYIDNLQGYFLRGLDTKGAIDKDGPQRKLGKPQNDATKLPNNIHIRPNEQHSHTYRSTDNGKLFDNSVSKVYTHSNFSGIGKPRYGVIGDKTTSIKEGHDHKIEGGDGETRPINVAVNYFIRIN